MGTGLDLPHYPPTPNLWDSRRQSRSISEGKAVSLCCGVSGQCFIYPLQFRFQALLVRRSKQRIAKSNLDPSSVCFTMTTAF
jgi:hypothetical protein